MVEQDLEQFKSGAQAAKKLGIDILYDMKDWKKISKGNDEVRVFSKPVKGIHFDIIKAEWINEKQPKDVARYMFENYADLTQQLLETDVSACTQLQRYEDQGLINKIEMKAAGLLQPRVITQSLFLFDEGPDEAYLAGQSVYFRGVEIPRNSEAGVIPYFLHLFEPVAGDSSRCFNQLCFLYDPKGTLSIPVKNQMIERRAEFYDQIRQKIDTLA